jgi:hypothetical protein
MKKVALPDTLTITEHKMPCVVNVRLKDGRVIRDLLCPDGKSLAGTVVGGRDGVVETDFTFHTADVAAVKLQTVADTFAPTRALKEKLHAL